MTTKVKISFGYGGNDDKIEISLKNDPMFIVYCNYLSDQVAFLIGRSERSKRHGRFTLYMRLALILGSSALLATQAN